MAGKREKTAGDGLPRQEGPYRFDWLKREDLPQVARLEAVFFPEPLDLESLQRLWAMPITCYIGVKKDELLAGYIGFQLFGPMAHTISMGVHPEHRRAGLATLIQETADRVAASRGARWFSGEVRVSNTAQLKFLLEKLGWIQIGVCPRFFKNGEDAVVVWHWL
ncbi:MAG: GNAT family N-acetyltransferase [Firmicutes bacterium]|jgi:ribosomal protein S18 acetylase RimI-like enzyme|nr:GNAT family N-acetyltransferase [Bacillota bacterium]